MISARPLRLPALLALTLALTLSPRPAGAEPYRLAPGDRLEVTWVGAEAPVDQRVDIDGTLRLPAIGAVEVAGLTLDDCETAIEAAIAKAGLFVDPRASVSITDYAPVLISGDVSTPGAYPYVPNLTVGSALGLSGGSRILGVERTALLRARADVEGRLVTLNAAIMASVTRIARLEAQRDGAETVALSPGSRAVIPAPKEALLADALANETAVFENDRARSAEMVGSWDREIDAMRRQQDLYSERIKVQAEVVSAVAKDLEAARALREKGLQTEAALTRAEQVDAEARSRALELESALVAAERATAEAERQKAQFLRAKAEDVLLQLIEERRNLADLLLRYGNAQSEGLVLADGTTQALLDSGTFKLVFTVIPARPEATPPAEVTMETRLWPGDALIVRIYREGTAQGG